MATDHSAQDAAAWVQRNRIQRPRRPGQARKRKGSSLPLRELDKSDPTKWGRSEVPVSDRKAAMGHFEDIGNLNK